MILGEEAEMADSTTDTESTETGTQDTGTDEQQSTEETSGQEQQPAAITNETRLPDDHPLVKSLASQKTELSTLRPLKGKVTELEAKIADLEPKAQQAEGLATLQTRYDRLESFLTSVGGPLSKALDSRSFTKDLFESDKDVAKIVEAFLRANPSATAAALGGAGHAGGTGKHNPNDLIRAAARRD
jgi:hypothetical protein